MPSLEEYWQSGYRGLHLEECINNAFSDFAPYAGADQQRIVISRLTPTPGRTIGWSSRNGDSKNAAAAVASLGTPNGPASQVPSSSSVIVEENGDFTVLMRDPRAGSMSFSTTGNMQMDAALRVDLPVWSSDSRGTVAPLAKKGVTTDVTTPSAVASPEKHSVVESTGRRSRDILAEGAASTAATTPPPAASTLSAGKPAPSFLRFTDFTRPLAMPLKKPAPFGTTAARSPAPWGQVELDVTLPNWSLNRQSVGARAGPAALRMSRNMSAPKPSTNSASLSDEDILAVGDKAGDGTGRQYQYTLDAAVCMPFGGSSAEGTRAVRWALDGTPVVVLPAAPWALTCGMQVPLALGDTLVGISLQNDRASSVTLPFPGVEWVTTVPVTTSSTASPLPGDPPVPTASEANVDACVPSLLYPHHSSSSANTIIDSDNTAAPLYIAIPSVTVSLLLVQTLASHTLERRSASNLSASHLDNSWSGDGASANSSRIVSSYDWRRLPTLIGVNVGINRDQLRVSAASILHNGEVDLETAAVLDVTPWMPRMPTLLKLGYNNAGRLAAGMTSLFYETVTATLGVHISRGEQAKFGIEVSF